MSIYGVYVYDLMTKLFKFRWKKVNVFQKNKDCAFKNIFSEMLSIFNFKHISMEKKKKKLMFLSYMV